MDGRVALVTGAGGGIGSAIVRTLLSRGAIVAASDRDEALGALLTDEMQDAGSRLVHFPGDLGDDAFCDGLPAAVEARLGGLDILVTNAGVMRRGNILNTSDEDWALSMRINVEAPFRLCRAAIALMKSGGGSIVNIASCWGLYPGPEHLVYCTTKAAVAAMTKCLGRDHAGDGIRVNAVCPNEVDTPMLRTGFELRGLDPDRAVASLDASVPLGRIATPEDIADVVAFLAGDEARYICGTCIEVNGAKPVG